MFWGHLKSLIFTQKYLQTVNETYGDPRKVLGVLEGPDDEGGETDVPPKTYFHILGRVADRTPVEL